MQKAYSATLGHLQPFQANTSSPQHSQAPTVTGDQAHKPTMIVQGPSATSAPIATPVSGLATASDLTYGIVAVIIVIIIAIGIVGLLLLRKKP